MAEKKYEMLIRRAKEIIAEYSMKLTIRQLYYRLVAANDIPSNRSQYVYYDKVLTKYRQEHPEFADNFEDYLDVVIKDKTRKVESDMYVYDLDTFSSMIRQKLNNIKRSYPNYWITPNRLQKKVTVILLEKQALESIFERAIGNMSILVVARGFNSFTQMKELADIVIGDDREFHLYTFSDFDDSGHLIEENFLRQTKEFLGIEWDSITRVALTQEYIEEHNLPLNPTKQSTHSKYNLPYFVELDAIDPRALTEMVEEVCSQNFDFELQAAIEKAFRARNRRLKKAYFRELKKIDLSKI